MVFKNKAFQNRTIANSILPFCLYFLIGIFLEPTLQKLIDLIALYVGIWVLIFVYKSTVKIIEKERLWL